MEIPLATGRAITKDSGPREFLKQTCCHLLTFFSLARPFFRKGFSSLANEGILETDRSSPENNKAKCVPSERTFKGSFPMGAWEKCHNRGIMPGWQVSWGAELRCKRMLAAVHFSPDTLGGYGESGPWALRMTWLIPSWTVCQRGQWVSEQEYMAPFNYYLLLHPPTNDLLRRPFLCLMTTRMQNWIVSQVEASQLALLNLLKGIVALCMCVAKGFCN